MYNQVEWIGVRPKRLESPQKTNSMKTNFRDCVLPGPTEEELITIAGDKPGTALRVRVESGQDGYVRLEQLAYSAGLGWYTQKSFCIPADMLAALVPQLRKADCLIPRSRKLRPDGDPIRLPLPAIPSESPRKPQRREA